MYFFNHIWGDDVIMPCNCTELRTINSLRLNPCNTDYILFTGGPALGWLVINVVWPYLTVPSASPLDVQSLRTMNFFGSLPSCCKFSRLGVSGFRLNRGLFGPVRGPGQGSDFILF